MVKNKKRHIILLFTALALILLVPERSFAQQEADTVKKSSVSKWFKRISKKDKSSSEQDTQTADYKAVISVDKLFFDYGDVLQGESAVAEFEITNTGKGILKVEDIEVSCNCVDINLSSYTVKPNSKAVLRLTYNTNIVGEIKRSITIVSNSSSDNRITLLLTGNVKVKN